MPYVPALRFHALTAWYDATALHMVIVDPSGRVVYNSAIDDQPKTDATSLAGAKNYVDAALTELLAGRTVTTPSSQPYGCEVHYKAGR